MLKSRQEPVYLHIVPMPCLFNQYVPCQQFMVCRCMCGAATCRGTMDTQPERLKDFGKRIEVWWEGDNVYYRGTVIAFSKKAHKHTILYDDHESEKVSLDITPHRCTLCPCYFCTGARHAHTTLCGPHQANVHVPV